MAASFKIPTSLKRKAKKDPELPKFEWKLFEKENKLGCGTFGSVYLAKERPEKVVAKNNNVESIDSKSCFEKEASLLNSTKGHRNIIRFLEFSIMTNNDGVFLLRFSPVWSCKKSLHSRRFCPFRRRV